MTPYPLLCTLLRKSQDQVPLEALLTDIVPDSFALVELLIGLQEDLGIRLDQEDLAKIKTVGQLMQLLEAKVG
jgi:acyl carrier protein